MPIDSDFPRLMVSTFTLFGAPGRSDAETSTKPEVQETYKARGEEYVPLGVHGTMVAVDWDSCYADSACIEACPVQLFQWYRTEQDVPAIQMANATSAGTGQDHERDGRVDYSDKSDPIREHDSIWCMACVSVCPPQAINVDKSNLEYHEKSAGTFNEDLARGSAPPPHAH